MTEPPTIRVEIDSDLCATLWLDRPSLNVLDLDTIAQLDAALVDLAAKDLAVVVVRGAGGRAFSAGVAIEDHTADKIRPMLDGFHSALRRLWALDVPTVAAVDGHCLGGGMELAAVCDFVIATERSTFGQPEIQLACFPPVAAALYPRCLSPGVAADLVLTGRRLSCAEAERVGFVSRRVDDLGLAIDELKQSMSGLSRSAIRVTKRALRIADPRGDLLDDALSQAEKIYYDQLAQLDDLGEGIEAFLAKRPPEWRHS